jgi:hypothetical protein
MSNETLETTRERLAVENERLRLHLGNAANELNLVLVCMVADENNELRRRLEGIAELLSRAAE